MDSSRLYTKFQEKTKTFQDHLWSIKDGKKTSKKKIQNKQPTNQKPNWHGGTPLIQALRR